MTGHDDTATMCGRCHERGWEDKRTALAARADRVRELRPLFPGPAPVVLLRKCKANLYHLDDPKPVQQTVATPRPLVELPGRPYLTPAKDTAEMAVYREQVLGLLHEAIAHQGPGKAWPSNRRVADHYSIRSSEAGALRQELLIAGVLRLIDGLHITAAPPAGQS